MNDDIKLPPLPERSEFTSLWEYTDGQMHDYARAAVELDRQHHDRMLAHEWIRPALGLSDDAPYRFDFYAQKIGELMVDHQHIADVRKMVPSDEEIRALAQEIYGQTWGGADIRFARALLSRYSSGQPAATGKPIGYALIEGGEAVAFFNEAPTGHYDASAYVPVGIIGQPAASAEPTAAEISDVVREITGCPDIKNGDKSLVVLLGFLFHKYAAQPAAPVAQEPVAYLVRGDMQHDQYRASRAQAEACERLRYANFDGEDQTVIIPLYTAPVAAQAQPVVNQQMTTAAARAAKDDK